MVGYSVVHSLLFAFLICLAFVSPHHQDFEAHVSPDSQGGEHQASNNHFSTSKTDDDSYGDLVTPSPVDTTTVTDSSVNDPEGITAPSPPEVATTHKADAKKDSKKKAKSSMPKKKDKNDESESEDVARSGSGVAGPGNSSVMSNAAESTTLSYLTTSHLEKSLHTEEVSTTAVTQDGGTETTSPDFTFSATTGNENLSSSDEQPPQTTLNDDAVVETTTKEIVESREYTTTEATLFHVSTVTENNWNVPSTVPGSHEGTTDVEPTTALDQPATTEDSENDDRNGLGNDLEDVLLRTTTSVPEVASVRKQKQVVMSDPAGEKCPCATSALDPSGCPGGRTAADPNCPCREVCARQSGQACSPREPCDEDFGLHCSPQNNTCTGQLSIRIFDVTHDSAKVTWGMSESELQPQALVSYATAYRGAHTQWTKVQDTKPVIHLENLLPSQNYYLKVEEDGRQEISAFRTKDDVVSSMPKILVKQRSQTTLTVVWDDFRLPSYHSEYILEYRPASSGNWTKVQAGTQTTVTVTHLTPNAPYEVKVAVWEDDKLELPSEVITAYTADGCVRSNRTYDVGEEFFLGCDFRCVCGGSNQSDCGPRCAAPYVRLGSKSDDPRCYEKVVPSDPCCVTIRCTESKALEDLEDVTNKSGECPEILEESEPESSCLSDCDHDRDCSGVLKCCPSSCGGAVCVRPLLPEDVCEHVYCGPNAECVSAKMACVCSEGYEGNPHDFLSGCMPVNSTVKAADDDDTRADGAEFGPDLTHGSESEAAPNDDSGNELGPEDDGDKKGVAPPTDAPFELDLRAHDGMTPDAPMDGRRNATAMTESPLLFDGCAFGNVTYDRGVKFEDGCDALCVCEGQGHVSCVPRCNMLLSGGPACREMPDPDDPCCRIMVCSFPGSSDSEHLEALPMKIVSAQAQNGTSVRVRLGISTPRLPTMAGRDIFEVWYREAVSPGGENDDLSRWHRKPVTQKDLTEVRRGLFELDINGLTPHTDYYVKVGRDSQGGAGLNTMAEFSNTVEVKTFPAAVKSVSEGCFHHNQSYALGEVFHQGCEHKCVCREKGFIECQDRCALYIDTVGYEGCDWVQSEEDPCCSVPVCNRRKIPLMMDERPPPPPLGGGGDVGPPDSSAPAFCVVGDEVYRVGDIWESADGCRTRICRCTQLPNGTTGVQCQSECPPLPPNAHLPTARCPRPVLVKPDGPSCRCPYVSCEEVPPRHHVVRPQCEFKGERYDMGREFYDGCIALCHCGQDLRVDCAAIECPYHFGAEFTNCLEWDIDPDFFPVPPKCCAPAKCRNDGSCTFSGRKFQNFEDIPAEILPCGARCVCVNGNVTCENRCPPVEDVPPAHLPCPSNRAHKGHPQGETCCLQWMCRELLPAHTAQASSPSAPHCVFQGSRYLVGEKWEVQPKGGASQQQQQRRTCTCRLGAPGHPGVECRGGCPQIPQRFLLPTEQCLRPVTVTPDDPLMCPYVVCNNTVSGQELYNVNVVALNSTAVRIRFSLSNILVGLIGHAELHFTTDPTLPAGQWHVQKFSRPKRLFDSPNIEYVLNALRPNTTYFLQVRIRIDALQGGPESELFKLRMPPPIAEMTTTSSSSSTTTGSPSVPPVIAIDPRPEAHVVDAGTVRISWKNIDPLLKRYVYALQFRYRARGEADKWITTPMIHRDVTSYFLHDLEPLTEYTADMVFTPPKDMPTKIVVSSKSLQFKTPGKDLGGEDYRLQVSVDEAELGAERSVFRLSGIPQPVPKHVHVIKIAYRPSDGEEDRRQSYSFREPDGDRVTLDRLEPSTRYVARLELYLTDGRTLTSSEVEFTTKPVAKEAVPSEAENTILPGPEQQKKRKAELLLQNEEEGGLAAEDRAYFVALVVVAVVAAVAGFGFVLLLVLLVRRQASAKAPISRTPSESAYDNPTYKTYDGEDKTNGQTIQTTQA